MRRTSVLRQPISGVSRAWHGQSPLVHRCACPYHPHVRVVRATRHVDRFTSARAPSRRRGVVLVLVVFFLFLAGTLSVLITANSVQLLRTTRDDHESILLRQMADSAYAWVAARPNWREVLPVELGMTGALSDGSSGSIRIQVDEQRSGGVVVEARLTLIDRHLSRTTRFTAPS